MLIYRGLDITNCVTSIPPYSKEAGCPQPSPATSCLILGSVQGNGLQGAIQSKRRPRWLDDGLGPPGRAKWNFFVISFQNEMLSPTRAPGPTEHPREACARVAVCDSVMQSTGDSGCQAVTPYPGFVFMCNDKLVFGLVFYTP